MSYTLKTTTEEIQDAKGRLFKSFEKHQLVEMPSSARRFLSFSCRNPDTWNYGFYVLFAPGTICISGDVGDCVFNVSDGDSLHWLLKTADWKKDFEYMDYFLSKMRASDSPKKEFRRGDALTFLREAAAEAREEGREDRALKIDSLSTQVRDDFYEFTPYSWYEKAEPIFGFDSFPDCQGVTWSALMAWEAARAFTRLYPMRTLHGS